MLCEYFSAPTDEVAAATLDLGPSHHGRSEAGERSPDAEPLAPLPFVDAKNIEPGVMMRKLEEILTGRSLEEIFQDSPHPVAVRDGGEGVVVRLPRALRDALAGAGDDELAAAVERWAQIDEFGGRGDVAVLRAGVGDLAGLARAAQGDSWDMYCWVCV